MAKPRNMKRDIDKTKKEKAAQKRERRQRPGAPDQHVTDLPPAASGPIDNDAVLAQLERLHSRFRDDEIEFEEFEVAKEALLGELATE
jgi:hypothetical protein